MKSQFLCRFFDFFSVWKDRIGNTCYCTACLLHFGSLNFIISQTVYPWHCIALQKCVSMKNDVFYPSLYQNFDVLNTFWNFRVDVNRCVCDIMPKEGNSISVLSSYCNTKKFYVLSRYCCNLFHTIPYLVLLWWILTLVLLKDCESRVMKSFVYCAFQTQMLSTWTLDPTPIVIEQYAWVWPLVVASLG